jgi:hypothetical protein
VSPTYDNADFTPLIRLRGYCLLSTSWRCGVCIANVVPQGSVHPPSGGLRLLRNGVTYSTAALYISPPTVPPHSVASPPPLYATAHTATSLRQLPRACPPTAVRPGESSSRRFHEGVARGSIAQPLSSPPAHTRDIHTASPIRRRSLEADLHEPCRPLRA